MSYDKYIGCLVGGAVGDALGWPVEFLTLRGIRERYGATLIRDFVDAEGGVGAVTDDTQMTLFTAEGLLDHLLVKPHPGCDPASSLHSAYLRWLRTQDEIGS